MTQTRLVTALVAALTVLLAVVVPLQAGTATAAPSAAKVPLIYVASSMEDATLAQSFVTPMRMRGYDVHVFYTNDPKDPANNPFVSIKGNSRKLGSWVDQLAKRTGASKFDVVGASQTGLVIRYWLKYFGGAQHARKVVLLSGMIVGSPYQAQWLREGNCPPRDRKQYLPAQYRSMNPTPACGEQAMGGAEITALNTPRQALPGVKYYNITTLQEEEAAPYWINLMTGPGDYRNIVTQNMCPNDPVVHLTLTSTPSVQSLIDSALRGGPLRMDCMVPSVPGAPTLRDSLKPLTTPPGITLPAGTRKPAGL